MIFIELSLVEEIGLGVFILIIFCSLALMVVLTLLIAPHALPDTSVAIGINDCQSWLKEKMRAKRKTIIQQPPPTITEENVKKEDDRQ